MTMERTCVQPNGGDAHRLATGCVAGGKSAFLFFVLASARSEPAEAADLSARSEPWYREWASPEVAQGVEAFMDDLWF
jgi:hypothetical protein